MCFICHRNSVWSRCCLHFKCVNSSIAGRFTNRLWDKVRSCAVEWLQSNAEEEKYIATRLVNGQHDLYNETFLGALAKQPDLAGFFHWTCFGKFTGRRRSAAAKSRLAYCIGKNEALHQLDRYESTALVSEDGQEKSTSKILKTRNTCIICKRCKIRKIPPFVATTTIAG